MDINILDKVRAARNNAISSVEGNRASVSLPAVYVTALLDALNEQEREIQSLKRSAEELADSLLCNDFSEYMPEDSDDGEIFEIFTGQDVDECARSFATWDASQQAFYEETTDGCTFYPNDVLHWRRCLPDPSEHFPLL